MKTNRISKYSKNPINSQNEYVLQKIELKLEKDLLY